MRCICSLGPQRLILWDPEIQDAKDCLLRGNARTLHSTVLIKAWRRSRASGLPKTWTHTRRCSTGSLWNAQYVTRPLAIESKQQVRSFLTSHPNARIGCAKTVGKASQVMMPNVRFAEKTCVLGCCALATKSFQIKKCKSSW